MINYCFYFVNNRYKCGGKNIGTIPSMLVLTLAEDLQRAIYMYLTSVLGHFSNS